MTSALKDTGTRFEMVEQGLTSFADYRRAGDRIVLDHVESPPALRGTGASGRLMEAMSADIRARGLKVTPVCSYAAAWLKRSEAYRSLLD